MLFQDDCDCIFRTFFKFEHFVFTQKGPQSKENAFLKLWKAINRYKKTPQRDKRDSLAVAIHKTFIFDQSKLNISIPDEMLSSLDPDVPYDRPSTPALKELQQLAEDFMDTLVQEFLQTEKTEQASLILTRERERFTKKVVRA